MTQHDGNDNTQDRYYIFNDEIHIYHHSDRHEEDSTEEILYRVYQMLYILSFERLTQDATHDESTECSRETYSRGKYHHTETEGKRRDEQRLIVHQRLYPLQEDRNEINTHNEP